MNLMLSAALDYQKKGLSVIPLKPREKTPLLASWKDYQTRRATEDEIKLWWTSFPTANVGVVTGDISGLTVLDLDGPDGLKYFQQNRVNSSCISLTGKGKQLWYKRPEGGIANSAGKIAKGVDVRGDGGYIVAPPSIHPNGKRYQFITGVCSVANLPVFPANLIAPVVSPKAAVGSSWVADELGNLQEGNRDTTFTRVVGRLFASGLDPVTVHALLRPYADRCGFTDLDKIIKSVSRYGPFRGSTPIDDRAASISDFLEDIKPVEWICKDIIAKSSVGFVAGLPETMKTWLLIDLAVECARGGGQWVGLFPVGPAKVLFVDQERFKGETQRRFKAIIRAKGLEPMSLKGSLYIRCGTTTRIDLEDSYRAFRSELLELKPDLVIIDSFATFHTREENDRKEIQTVLERIKQLRSEIGCTFIFIDHEGKSVWTDKQNNESPSAFRMVGSVGKTAAAEFVLTVRRYDETTSTVYHTKSTLARTVPCFNTTVRDVPEGIVVEGVQS